MWGCDGDPIALCPYAMNVCQDIGTPNLANIMNDNKWHHFAFTYDGTTGKLYLDGNMLSSKVLTVATANTELTFGYFSWTSADPNGITTFKGYLSESLIIDSALSLIEVQQLFLPKLPTIPNSNNPVTNMNATSYTWTCAAGYVGSSMTMTLNTSDNSWVTTGGPMNCQLPTPTSTSSSTISPTSSSTATGSSKSTISSTASSTGSASSTATSTSKICSAAACQIQIISASYGMSCSSSFLNNFLLIAKYVCNEQALADSSSCAIKPYSCASDGACGSSNWCASYESNKNLCMGPGDIAPNCAKDFRLTYKCSDNGTIFTAPYSYGEAKLQNPVIISCPSNTISSSATGTVSSSSSATSTASAISTVSTTCTLSAASTGTATSTISAPPIASYTSTIKTTATSTSSASTILAVSLSSSGTNTNTHTESVSSTSTNSVSSTGTNTNSVSRTGTGTATDSNIFIIAETSSKTTASSTGTATSSSTCIVSSTSTSTASSTSTIMSSVMSPSTKQISSSIPQKWVSFFITFRGNNPGVLMSDASFVCALRTAFSKLSAVPLYSVRLVGITTVTGESYPVLVSQVEGICNSRILLDSRTRLSHVRQLQSLSSLSAEVSIDVLKTVLSITNSELVVRSTITTAFEKNISLIDHLFLPVTSAACTAQGIPSNLCPNPPSIVILLSTPDNSMDSQSEAVGNNSFIVGVITGTFVGVIFMLLIWLLVWYFKKVKHSKSKTSTESPALTIRHITLPLATPREELNAQIKYTSPTARKFEVRTVFEPVRT